MKNLVIEMHSLIPYAVNAANRGEFGEIKNAVIGGVSRVVMSSQSIKYSIRRDMAPDHIRSTHVEDELKAQCVNLNPALESDKKFDKYLNDVGKIKDTVEVTSEEELTAIAQIIVQCYAKGVKEKNAQTEITQFHNENNVYMDLWTSAFGRMSTNSLLSTVESAVSFGMSYSVDAYRNQTDYLSVVDSLKEKYSCDELNANGAANLQNQPISSNVMYRYMNFSVGMMLQNFNMEQRLKALNTEEEKNALIDTVCDFVSNLLIEFCYQHPVAKQHAMASMPTPSMVAIFTGENIFPMTMDCAWSTVVQNTGNGIVSSAHNRVRKWLRDEFIFDQYDTANVWLNTEQESYDNEIDAEMHYQMNKVYPYIKKNVWQQVRNYITKYI